MSSHAYRLTMLHQKVDQAILDELRKLVPSNVKLLRLRTAKLAIRNRLKALFSRPQP